VQIRSLWAGFHGSDWVGVAAVAGIAPRYFHGLNVYRMAGTPEEVARQVEAGLLPWWTHLDFKFAFLRPLSSSLLILESSLFGVDATRLHILSFAWFAAAIFAAGLLYRRLFSAPAAAVALAFFAASPGNAVRVGWVGNRHAMIAVSIALLGLVAHIRWRETKWAPGRVLGVLGLVLGLSGGETALQVFLFFVAYELVGARDRLRVRLAALGPLVAIVGVYLIAYRALHYGIRKLPLYFDVVSEPARYATGALDGLPNAIIDLALPSIVRQPLVHWSVRWIAAGLVVAFVVGLVRRTAKLIDPEHARHMRWLFLGSALTLPLMLMARYSDRNNLVPLVGISGALAPVLVTCWKQRRGVFLAGIVVFALGTCGGLLQGILTAGFMQNRSAQLVRTVLEMPAAPTTRDVILVSSGNTDTAVERGNFVRALFGAPTFRRWHVLSNLTEDITLTRIADDVLELRCTAPQRPDDLLNWQPFQPGDERTAPGFRAHIVAVEHGVPSQIRFTFDHALDSAELFVVSDRALKPTAVPPIGSSTVVHVAR
jgi:hypothetical protein